MRQTHAAKMMSRSVHKPVTVIGSSIFGRDLSSAGFHPKASLGWSKMEMKVKNMEMKKHIFLAMTT